MLIVGISEEVIYYTHIAHQLFLKQSVYVLYGRISDGLVDNCNATFKKL